jgi:hypothetical protein
MAHLTRKEMQEAIEGGGSVLYNGQTLWQVAQLPSDADLATDEDSKVAAAGDLQAQIAALSASLAKLQATPAKAGLPDTSKAESKK